MPASVAAPAVTLEGNGIAGRRAVQHGDNIAFGIELFQQVGLIVSVFGEINLRDVMAGFALPVPDERVGFRGNESHRLLLRREQRKGDGAKSGDEF